MSVDMKTLSDRMLEYEKQWTGIRFHSGCPIVARLDGRSFHSFTKGLKRPYDKNFSNLMKNSTRLLVAETGARVGYTQSDEITLIFYPKKANSQIFFGGKPYKLISILASMTTVFFNRALRSYLPNKANEWPMFDCRAWDVPNLEEAVNTLIWRELDATRNSKQMAGQEYFSHRRLQNKNTDEICQMLLDEHGIDWNDYPDFFKYGTYIIRRTITSKLSEEEFNDLPPLHNARKNPDLEVERDSALEWNISSLLDVDNRVEELFG